MSGPIIRLNKNCFIKSLIPIKDSQLNCLCQYYYSDSIVGSKLAPRNLLHIGFQERGAIVMQRVVSLVVL